MTAASPPHSSPAGSSAATARVDVDAPTADQSLARAQRLVESGNALEDRGDLDGALAQYRDAVAAAPAYARGYVNLGNALSGLGKVDEAIAAQRSAVQLDPELAAAPFNLGNLLARKRDFAAAEEHLRVARRLAPEMADAAVMLAHVLESGGRLVEAERELRSVVDVDPCHPGAALNLGILLQRQSRHDEAEAAFARAVAADPGFAPALAALANRHLQSGRPELADDTYRKALAASPDSAAVYSSMLFALNFRDDLDAQTIFDEHRRFGRRFEGAVQPPVRPSHELLGGQRKLKVGYLSGDLQQHPVALFLRPILEHHDRAAVAVYCYSNSDVTDALTLELKSLTDHWRDIAALDDAAAEALIRADGIDVLVDLSGHTAGSRLLLFTRRCAALQLTWLGYLNTSGLTSTDFRICDRHTDPPGSGERLHTERLYRMPHSQWCYAPVYDVPVMPLPHPEAPRRVVFGSFNQFPKISDSCLDLWCELIRKLPESELVVLGVPEGRSRSSFIERIECRGVEGHRVTLRARSGIAEYFAAIGGVDIALDTFPYNGGTTTLDTLWMGVPVVALAGDRGIARGSFSILSTLGMPELIASSRSEYVERNLRLAADANRRAWLRRTLRPGLERSPLMDVRSFTRDLERGYREMLATLATAYNHAGDPFDRAR